MQREGCALRVHALRDPRAAGHFHGPVRHLAAAVLHALERAVEVAALREQDWLVRTPIGVLAIARDKVESAPT